MVEKVKKAKRKLNTLVGFACVHATFNNTIVSITDHITEYSIEEALLGKYLNTKLTRSR